MIDIKCTPGDCYVVQTRGPFISLTSKAQAQARTKADSEAEAARLRVQADAEAAYFFSKAQQRALQTQADGRATLATIINNDLAHLRALQMFDRQAVTSQVRVFVLVFVLVLVDVDVMRDFLSSPPPPCSSLSSYMDVHASNGSTTTTASSLTTPSRSWSGFASQTAHGTSGW